MSSNPDPNPPAKKSHAANVIVSIIVILFVYGVIHAVGQALINTNKTKNVAGFVISLDTYNGGCVPEAESDGTIEHDVAVNYCSCTYNEGVAFYGGEQFTKELTAMSKTNTFSPKMSEIVNECVQRELQ